VGDARFDYAALVVAWFDHWLKDAPLDMPAVRYFMPGAGEWRSAASWPPPGAHAVTFYLRSDGHANSLFGDGKLDVGAPGAAEPADAYRYDPLHPVPRHGGGCCGDQVALDQVGIEARNDVLVYSTEPLAKPLDIAGFVSAGLYVSSSVPDTDVMVKLVDVYPDGRAINLDDTGLRLRYRDGFDRPAPMQPGTIYRATLGEMATAARLPTGHRLRIEIASSNFSGYERNLNTGGSNFDETVPQIANNRIHHDAAHPSSIELSVLSE
jgi:putative CocE/NonD family hydrolase